MKKSHLFLIALFLLFGAGLQRAFAQSYAEDTVWTMKTDQSAGMFQVKFSNNDSIIWAMGLENGLFFNAQTGQEIKRIPGTQEVFFINNDQQFIKLNTERTFFEIFDSKTFQVVGALENDGTIINEYPKCDISKDEKYLVAPITKGFRIWDLTSKNILRTKLFPNEENLLNIGVSNTRFTKDMTKIIAQFGKTIGDPNIPSTIKNIGCFMVFDVITLDSIDSFKNSQYFKLSVQNKYIAYGTGDPTYGLEVYDFNTKELIWKIPINGPSLTGIEFSPDDKYLVTSPTIQIWDVLSKQMVTSYQSGSSRNIAISNDGQYIISSIGRYFYKWYARWDGTSVEEPEHTPILIYPNPTNGLININFNNPINEITKISLNDINGIQLRNLYNGNLDIGQQSLTFDVNELANGTYYIKVNNSQLSLFFKLIIIR